MQFICIDLGLQREQPNAGQKAIFLNEIDMYPRAANLPLCACNGLWASTIIELKAKAVCEKPLNTTRAFCLVPIKRKCGCGGVKSGGDISVVFGQIKCRENVQQNIPSEVWDCEKAIHLKFIDGKVHWIKMSSFRKNCPLNLTIDSKVRFCASVFHSNSICYKLKVISVELTLMLAVRQPGKHTAVIMWKLFFQSVFPLKFLTKNLPLLRPNDFFFRKNWATSEKVFFPITFYLFLNITFAYFFSAIETRFDKPIFFSFIKLLFE